MQRIWIEFFFIKFKVSLCLFLFHIVFATHLIYLLFARFVLHLFCSNLQFSRVFRFEELMASARLFFNTVTRTRDFPLFPPVLFCLVCVVFTGTTCLTFSYCFRSETCEFYVSQLVGETSRDTAHPCQDGEEGINAVKKRHIGGNVSVVREVIDSSESRQNYQDGEGFSDLSGYPVESRTHPRGYLSESPFRGQVHKSGTSSIRTAEH